MRIAYFDLVSGASGDMILGALVDAGLRFEDLQAALGGLMLPEFELAQSRVMRGAFSATKIDVKTSDSATARHLPEIEALVTGASLPPPVQERALGIFRRMVMAEASIHHMPPEQVHLHELGAVDTIVDVTGALLGIELLGIQRIVVSPIPLGRGMSGSSHGRMPLPAPATLALLKGAPIVGIESSVETVTPTAAAVLTELANAYGPIPPMRLTAVGYGAGSRTVPEPNILRVLLGDGADLSTAKAETLSVLETNIDNMNPEVSGYVMERLLASGALDVTLAPIFMKKNRPATLLSVVCRPEDAATLRSLIFAETTTLGIRSQDVTRHYLTRDTASVNTPFGTIRIKVSQWSDDSVKVAPEYEDCAHAARTSGVPLREVYEAALAAYRKA